MAPSAEEVQEIFQALATKDYSTFFSHVIPDVDWTVMGTHPCAGRYHSVSDFQICTSDRLGKLMKDGIALTVRNVISSGASGDWTVTEMVASAECKNGLDFDNTYAWVCRWDKEGKKIVQVRAYLDSTLVKQAVEENECPSTRADTKIE